MNSNREQKKLGNHADPILKIRELQSPIQYPECHDSKYQRHSRRTHLTATLPYYSVVASQYQDAVPSLEAKIARLVTRLSHVPPRLMFISRRGDEKLARILLHSSKYTLDSFALAHLHSRDVYPASLTLSSGVLHINVVARLHELPTLLTVDVDDQQPRTDSQIRVRLFRAPTAAAALMCTYAVKHQRFRAATSVAVVGDSRSFARDLCSRLG
ncbi:hypothetical protein QAD02_010351 [Eretmocerus hayati]|uniref:Uncharacterized protein n=1 Tax=Eretmocerus hayati TaxID=131215 RepID=A0ACC2ND33_9HYME|nr:hypothetical protein QAD02_010351 [Eretmocerus hayati]